MVRKEFSDHIRSWRFGILLGIIFLACIGSLYSAISALLAGSAADQAEDGFLFLRMFTLSDGSLPNFTAFVSFLGPLMGIALGFDAVNTERSKGTLSRLISQPIYRDDFLKAKFAAALLIIGIVIFTLGLLVMGLGLLVIGFPPTFEEFARVVLFLLAAVVYVGFWLNLAILLSIRFRQAATSALSAISLWIFFSVFYSMIMGLIARSLAPESEADTGAILSFQRLMLSLNRLSPAELFNEATTTLLMPAVRSLGPLTMEQLVGALPSPLPLGQSLLLVWPQLTGLLAATMICFGISYYLFMRQEIRSRS
ncbi:ABC transporter permease subunit [Paenibacillus sp. 1P07SE]